MTIYNFNLGIGWASSGVEYAQFYRSKILQSLAQPAKFIFLDFIGSDNIQHLTRNIGFSDEDVIWLYQYFSDIPIGPTTYRLTDLEATFSTTYTRFEDQPGYRRYFFANDDVFITAYLDKKKQSFVERAEFVSQGKLIRKDFFTSQRLFSEYYAPRDKRAYLYKRHFFNQNGSIAYEEIIDGENVIYRFKDKILYNKSQLVAYFMKSLALTDQDMIILDRSTKIGQTIIEHSRPAKLAVAIHAEHYSPSYSNENHILWNNFYEYQFDEARHVDLFITATDKQKRVLRQQFRQYTKENPRIETIPVGNLAKLTQPSQPRKAYALVTASRLAAEKHIDWLIRAVVEARKTIPQLTFDIFGKGGEQQKLEKLISENHAEAYIKLKGHVKMDDLYQNYSAYVSASTSEGFGLTLMEAVGSGLPIIGFDVPYGNQTFIEEQTNGYLVPFNREAHKTDTIHHLAGRIILLFEQHRVDNFSKESYRVARKYLATNVKRKWKKVIDGVINK